MLDTLTLRFTQPVDFNDPFEMRPNIAAMVPPEQLHDYLRQFAPHAEDAFRSRLSQFLGNTGPPESQNPRLPPALLSAVGELFVASFEHIIPAALEANRERFSSHVQTTAGDKIGILSLSEGATDLLMWAHYASSHQGFLLEFDSEHPFFDQPRKNPHEVFRRLHPMMYSTERPAVTLYDPQADWVEWGQAFAKQAFLTKSPEWGHEREWRMFLPLDDPVAHPHEVRGRIHLFPYPPEALTGVVLGARCQEMTRTAMTKALQSGPLAHVKLSKARVSPTRFEVTLEPADETRS